MSLSCQKHLFSLDHEVSYLNNAYRGPILKSSEEAAIQELIRMRNPQTVRPDDFFNRVVQVKSLFGKLVGCQEDQIAIVPSTSYGFAAALNNWKSGRKKGVLVKDEFPSGYFSLKRWADENDSILQIIEPDDNSVNPGESWNQKLLEAIDQHTAVVLISSVHWMSGVKYDLEAIGEKCQKVGALFIVDGTQSVGAMPIDVKKFKIDVLVCAAYKWLLGPYSLGLAYFGEKLDHGKPLEESWMNRTNSRNFADLTRYQENFLPHANRYDVGEISHFILMPMLEKSLEQLLEWDPIEIQSYALQLKKILIDFQRSNDLGLDFSSYSSSHLFSLPIKKGLSPALIKESLDRNQVYVSLRGESLRVSINVFNEPSDLENLKSVLGEVYSQI